MGPGGQDFLGAAQSIGSNLCQTAFWSGSRCTWIGRSIVDFASPDTPTNKALSPELYEGTSGVAMFLGSLYSFNKSEDLRRTAEGAMSQALSRLDTVPSVSRFGFYSGRVGIAYAAAKLGPLLKASAITESSWEILRGLTANGASEQTGQHLMDVVSGNAGAIPALLELYRVHKEEAILELSSRLGDELVSTAVEDDRGASWDSRSNGMQPVIHNLTGFAHGAAGIGYALLELYKKTDKREYLEVAEKAFRYEDSWFNEVAGNWPDFRIDAQRPSPPPSDQFSYSAAWCHGAPGIGFSRLRAYQLLRDEKYFKDCTASLSVASTVAERGGSYGQNDFSLCHGLSGIGDLFLFASDVLNDASYRGRASEVGKYGLETFARRGLPWPCGIRTGVTPGLMLGVAGIGTFYLRLYDSKRTASPLIITPVHD